MPAPTPTSTLLVQASAPRLAPKKQDGLRIGGANTIVLTSGVTIKGVLRDARGKPLPNRVVRICQASKNAGTFVGPVEIGTNDKGRYELPNVPPNDDCVLFVAMDSLQTKHIGVPMQKIRTGKDGDVQNVDLAAAPVCTIRGRVTLTDGKPIPPNTRLLIDRAEAWDTQQVTLAADGRFVVHGVPCGEEIALTTYVRGHKLAPRTPNYLKWRNSAVFQTPAAPAELTANLVFEPEVAVK